MRMSVEAVQGGALAGSPEPLYAQIARRIKQAAVQNRLKSGDYLPSEPELVRHFGVSRDTVRHAIRRLTQEGFVRVQRGRGTLVAESPIEQELVGLTGFVEDMLALGLQPSAKVLSIRVVEPSDRVRRELRLPGSSDVVEIRRVRLANDIPLSYDVTWLPRFVGDRIASEDLERQPIFSVLEDKYAMPLTEADYRIRARNAGRDIADALGIPMRRPVLEIERTSFTADGPIDYERLYYRADRMTFRMFLKRKHNR